MNKHLDQILAEKARLTSLIGGTAYQALSHYEQGIAQQRLWDVTDYANALGKQLSPVTPTVQPGITTLDGLRGM